MNFPKVFKEKNQTHFVILYRILLAHHFHFPLLETLLSYLHACISLSNDNCFKKFFCRNEISVFSNKRQGKEGRQGNCNMRLKHIVIWGKWLLWCSPKRSFFSLLPLPEGKTILWVNCRGSEALIYGQKEKRNTTENG